jgi:formylglycine-generating enzyme required for sulfatase activity
MNIRIVQRLIPLVAATLILGFAAGSLLAIAVPRTSTQAAGCGDSAGAIGGFVRVEGGGFVKGANGLYPEEGRPTRLFVSPFLIQVNEVTNDQFAAFVAATGYVTEAEAARGSARFVPEGANAEPFSWWRMDTGVSWRTPAGPGSKLDGRGRHPVVHVSLNDARAYAEWAGGRIPNEVEWEYAASLGLRDAGNPVSGVKGPRGEALANVWTGSFPLLNTAEDGFADIAPAGCYPPSQIGTYDMIGNVWEWTDSRFQRGDANFTIKGGSFLCSDDYCRRSRTTARQRLEADFSAAHVGFRIVKDV